MNDFYLFLITWIMLENLRQISKDILKFRRIQDYQKKIFMLASQGLLTDDIKSAMGYRLSDEELIAKIEQGGNHE